AAHPDTGDCAYGELRWWEHAVIQLHAGEPERHPFHHHYYWKLRLKPGVNPSSAGGALTRRHSNQVTPHHRVLTWRGPPSSAMLDLFPEFGFRDNLKPSQVTDKVRAEMIEREQRTRNRMLLVPVIIVVVADLFLYAAISGKALAFPWA